MKKAKKKEEVAVVEETKEVVVIPEVTQPPVPMDYKSKLTRAQVDVIKSQIAKGATDDELKMFLYVCERTKLDPFTKQVHFVKRWDSKAGKEVGAVQVGIDGLRSIAERTGDYAGNDDPVFDGTITVGDKPQINVPEKATVTVYKMVQGQRYPCTASAKWKSYYPGDKMGFMWRKLPELMLGKCAEALALRKAFPSVMSGLYVAEEMGQAQTVQVIAETDFSKAKRMLEKVASTEELEKAKLKLEKSDKYSDEEKVELKRIIDETIAQIDASKTVS